jgi:hypothetical protein
VAKRRDRPAGAFVPSCGTNGINGLVRFHSSERSADLIDTGEPQARRSYSLNCRSFAFICSISACWLLMLPHSTLILGSYFGACSHLSSWHVTNRGSVSSFYDDAQRFV